MVLLLDYDTINNVIGNGTKVTGSDNTKQPEKN